MDDFHGFGKRYIDIFRFASHDSECLGLLGSFGECCQSARAHQASVITTNVFAAYGARDILDGLETKIFIIPAPIKYHALYLNLFPYVLTLAEVINGQVKLSAKAVEELMLRVGQLWHSETGYLRNHSLFFDPDYVRSNLHKVEMIQKRLSNQASKDAFTRFVYADPFDQCEYVITNLLGKIQYFDYISPLAGGVVINCGVDNGWELPFFLSTMGATARIYNIDPTGNENLSDYSAVFCNSPFCQNIISFHKQAVWDSCGELEFNDNTVSEKGSGGEGKVNFVVESVTIDKFCETHSIATVDVIKMDLEGAEPRAIRGMMNTVAKHRPQLAICVYHGKDQCFDIPCGLMNDLHNYNFYFDTYFVDTGESVLYCIPKEIDRRPVSPIVLEPVLGLPA
jgi:FkbM family methyltransferase